jgi:sortase A
MVSAVHEPRGAPRALTADGARAQDAHGDVILTDAHCPFCSALVAEQVALPWPQTPRRCRSCESWIGPRRAVEARREDAHCPHCRSLVAEGVGLPWPPAPRRCRSCDRWIGRNRAAEAPRRPRKATSNGADAASPRRRARASRSDAHARAPAEAARPHRKAKPSAAARPLRKAKASAAALPLRKAKPSDTGTRASIRLYEVTLNACERVLGDRHPHTLAARHDVAAAYAAAGDFAMAIPLYEETVAGREAVIGPDHPDTVASREDLAAARRSAEAVGGSRPDRPAPVVPLVERLRSLAQVRPRRPEAARGPTVRADRRGRSALEAMPALAALSQAVADLPLPRPRLPRPRRRAAEAKPPRTPLGRVVHAFAVLMVALGALVVTDAFVTLFWQEPITALIAAGNRGEVNHQLDAMLRSAEAQQTRQRLTRQMIARDAAELNLRTPDGHALGRIRIPRIGISFTIVQGEDEGALEYGPGHYPQTPLPGAAGHWTVGIAGHRTTYLAPFRNIDQLRPGDRIFVTMPYARFTYVVGRTIIVPPTDHTIFAAVGHNRLALSACNPPFSAAQRIIVYAHQTRMTPLVSVESHRRIRHSAIERLWKGVLA